METRERLFHKCQVLETPIHILVWKGEGITTQGSSEDCELYQIEGSRMRKPTAGEHGTVQHRNTC